MKAKLIFTLKAWPIIAVLTIGLCYLTSLLAKVLFGIELGEQAPLEVLRQVITTLIKNMCAADAFQWAFFSNLLALLRIILFLTVLVPIAEETIFRWVLFELPKPARPIVPAITSSLIFSAAHYIDMPWPNDAFIALFIFGLAQCWLYRKTDALWCPMLNHGLFNATNLVLMFVLPS